MDCCQDDGPCLMGHCMAPPGACGAELIPAPLPAVAAGRAAEALPDPVLRLGAANLPTDSFAFNQEAMTQFQVGLSQAIPLVTGDGRHLALRDVAAIRIEDGPPGIKSENARLNGWTFVDIAGIDVGRGWGSWCR
jgi:hypothetical protein